MRILLLNPPHPSIGSRIPSEHLPPLGLLSIGGPLIDAGHEVQLLDAEFGVWPFEIWNFLFHDRHLKYGPTLNEFWDMPKDGEEKGNREPAYNVSYRVEKL